MINWDLVKDLAEQVRRWAEDYVKKDVICGLPCLSGMCAKSAARLNKLLTKHEIDAKLCLAATPRPYGKGSTCHVFNMINNTIVDVTATQFNTNEDDVVIKPFKEGASPWYWQTATVFNNPDELRTSQVNLRWPEYQTAMPEEYNI
jgi:hypothetical protein